MSLKLTLNKVSAKRIITNKSPSIFWKVIVNNNLITTSVNIASENPVWENIGYEIAVKAGDTVRFEFLHKKKYAGKLAEINKAHHLAFRDLGSIEMTVDKSEGNFTKDFPIFTQNQVSSTASVTLEYTIAQINKQQSPSLQANQSQVQYPPQQQQQQQYIPQQQQQQQQGYYPSYNYNQGNSVPYQQQPQQSYYPQQQQPQQQQYQYFQYPPDMNNQNMMYQNYPNQQQSNMNNFNNYNMQPQYSPQPQQYYPQQPQPLRGSQNEQVQPQPQPLRVSQNEQPSASGNGLTSEQAEKVQKEAGEQGYVIDFSEIIMKKKIASGAFGEVWEGEWSGTAVAIKRILNPNFSAAELDDFCKEILLMSKLRHPNIVQFLGVCLKPEFCLVIEFMDKGSLFHVLKKEPNLGWDVKINFIKNITSGMLYLHSHGIVHRDIKSLNILVNQNNKAAITDFGLTKKVQNANEMLSTRVGSPAWSAPEILRGEQYNEKADVYSFGIVLWEIISGSPPYPGMDAMTILQKIGYGQGFRPPIPACPYPKLIELMVACWSDNPNNRPPFSHIWNNIVSSPTFPN